jgi:hypothetical protein
MKLTVTGDLFSFPDIVSWVTCLYWNRYIQSMIARSGLKGQVDEAIQQPLFWEFASTEWTRGASIEVRTYFCSYIYTIIFLTLKSMHL